MKSFPAHYWCRLSLRLIFLFQKCLQNSVGSSTLPNEKRYCYRRETGFPLDWKPLPFPYQSKTKGISLLKTWQGLFQVLSFLLIIVLFTSTSLSAQQPPVPSLVGRDAFALTYDDASENRLTLFLPSSLEGEKVRLVGERLLGRETLYHPEIRQAQYQAVIEDLILQPLLKEPKGKIERAIDWAIRSYGLEAEVGGNLKKLGNIYLEYSEKAWDLKAKSGPLLSEDIDKYLRLIEQKDALKTAGKALLVVKGILTADDVIKAYLVINDLLQDETMERLNLLEKSLQDTSLMDDPAFTAALRQVKKKMQEAEQGWYDQVFLTLKEKGGDLASTGFSTLIGFLPHGWAYSMLYGTYQTIAKQEDTVYRAILSATIQQALHQDTPSQAELAQLDYYAQMTFYNYMVEAMKTSSGFGHKVAGDWKVYYQGQLDIVTEELFLCLQTTSPVVSPVADSKSAPNSILFISNRTGKYQIYAMDMDGSNQRRLTKNSSNDFSPSFSPDKSTIVFGSDRGGNGDIYLMDTDGKNQTRLTNDSGDDSFASFSPDGNQILFSSNRGGSWKIFLMDTDGNNQEALTNNPWNDKAPSFSTDGSKIVFFSDRDGNNEIYIMNSDGSNQERLTDMGGSDAYPSFSPEGKYVVFNHCESNWKDQIYIMNTDGPNIRPLTTQTNWNSMVPKFSPDGAKIIFYREDEDYSYVETMNIDGSGIKRLTHNSCRDQNPAW